MTNGTLDSQHDMHRLKLGPLNKILTINITMSALQVTLDITVKVEQSTFTLISIPVHGQIKNLQGCMYKYP